MSTTHPTKCLHLVLDCARMLAECTSIWHHSLMWSNHSLLGLPRTPVPSIMPNTAVCCPVSRCVRESSVYRNNVITGSSLFFVNLCHATLLPVRNRHPIDSISAILVISVIVITIRIILFMLYFGK